MMSVRDLRVDGNYYFLDLGINSHGAYVNLRQGPASRDEILDIIDIAQAALATAPDHSTACHGRNEYCLDPACEICIAEKRAAKIREVFPPNVRPTRVDTGVVYMVRCAGAYKIGATKNLKQRVGQLRVTKKQAVEVIHSITSNDIFRLETYWLHRFIDYHVRGEWFALPPDAIAEFRQQVEMEVA